MLGRRATLDRVASFNKPKNMWFELRISFAGFQIFTLNIFLSPAAPKAREILQCPPSVRLSVRPFSFRTNS